MLQIICHATNPNATQNDQQVGWLKQMKQMKQKLCNTHHKLMLVRMKQMPCISFQLAYCLTSSAIESRMLLTFL